MVIIILATLRVTWAAERLESPPLFGQPPAITPSGGDGVVRYFFLHCLFIFTLFVRARVLWLKQQSGINSEDEGGGGDEAPQEPLKVWLTSWASLHDPIPPPDRNNGNLPLNSAPVWAQRRKQHHLSDNIKSLEMWTRLRFEDLYEKSWGKSWKSVYKRWTELNLTIVPASFPSSFLSALSSHGCNLKQQFTHTNTRVTRNS